jgi:hypothetical protein
MVLYGAQEVGQNNPNQWKTVIRFALANRKWNCDRNLVWTQASPDVPRNRLRCEATATQRKHDTKLDLLTLHLREETDAADVNLRLSSSLASTN